MVSKSTSSLTAADLIRLMEHEFAAADLFYGHGTANARDEAAALVFHVLQLDHADAPANYGHGASDAERNEILRLGRQRIDERMPLPYLLGEAWFAGMPFFVDERVLIPRSPIAELIAQGFEPWTDSAGVHSILEVGTGSGCIAIACARAFPQAQVVATDISADALAVAAINVERHAVGARVQLLATDHMDGVEGPFDLIIANPPYVPQAELAELAAEYRHEPVLGLISGPDGLDSARRILQDAPGLLSARGLLVLEVGAQWQELEQAFPELVFSWPEFEQGGIGVALIRAADFH